MITPAKLEPRSDSSFERDAEGDSPFWISVRRLWVGALRHRWSSLLIVPASPRLAATEVGRALTSVATRALGTAPLFVDLTGADLALATRAAGELRRTDSALKRIVICDVPWEHEAAIPVALACDAAIIGVRLGHTTRDELMRTAREIAPVHVIGTVLLEEKAP